VDSLTFIGTATTLIRLGEFTVLTDPNFIRRGQRAYLGKGFWSRRLTEPAIRIEDLPPLSTVVLSHLHGDHFDRVARRGLDRSVPIVTTQAAADSLRRHGFHTHGLHTWQTYELSRGAETLTVEAVPAVHARGPMRRLLPPVMGSVLTHVAGGEPRLRLYVTGDTVLGPHLEEIPARHPAIDVVVVHLGDTRIFFSQLSMNGEQGAEVLRATQARLAIPVHYDDYRVFRERSLEGFLRSAKGRGPWQVVAPARGETVPLRVDPVGTDPL
jgi:L-ascorbate metabolism protein UlaG (beta-lactamase superfamily)